MNSADFLANFSYIANAPDGINRLREVVRQLGVTGNLVTHAGDLEDVESLIKSIDELKTEFIATGEIRNSKSLPAIEAEQKTLNPDFSPLL